MAIDQENEMINEILFQSNKKEIKVKNLNFLYYVVVQLKMQKLYLIMSINYNILKKLKHW